MLSKLFKIYALINVLFLVHLSQGQNVFNNYYSPGTNNVSWANQVDILNEDSTYLIYSPWQNPGSVQGLRLTRLSKTGNLLIDNKFMFGNLSFNTYINNKLALKLNDYSSLVIGDAYFGGDRGLIFCKINNKQADTIHTKYYCDHVYSYDLNTRFFKSKNQIWYLGTKFHNTNNTYAERPTIFKVDTNGNYLGQLEIPSLLKYFASSLYYDTALKRIYIGATDYTNNLNLQTHVVCMDTSGNVIWDKLCTDLIHLTNIEGKNNYLVLSGLKFTNNVGGNNQYKMTLLKVDCNNNGNTIWQKNYGSENVGTGFYDLTINADESIIAVGCYKKPNIVSGVYHDGVIFKSNSNGDSLWMRLYSNHEQGVQEIFYDVQKTSDGGYIMCGAPNYYYPSQSWVVKTDSLGNAPLTGSVILGVNNISSDTEGFVVYPNPASDYVNIALPNTIDEFKVEIHNSMGQLVKEEIITAKAKTITVNTSQLSGGIYLATIKSKNQSFGKRFVIER